MKANFPPFILWLLLLISPTAYAQKGNTMYDLESKIPAERLLDLADSALIANGRPDSALIYNLLLATKYRHKKNLTAQEKRYTAMGYNRCGFIYMFYLFNYASAVECLIKADKYCEDEKLRVSINQNMGHLYCLYAVCFPSESNVSSARYYYQASFTKALQLADWNDVVSSFFNFWNFGLGEENLKAFEKQTTLFERAKVPASTPYYQYAQAMLKAIRHLQNKRYNEAAAILRGQASSCRTSIDDRLRCASCWHLASVYKAAGQADSALFYSLQLEQMGKEMKLKDVETDADKLLYSLYAEKGDRANADHYHLAYFKNRDSLLITNNLNSVKSNHLLSNVRNLAQEVDDLKQKRRVQNQLLLLIVGIILITAAFLAVLYRKNRQLKKQNLTLYQKMQVQIAYDKPKYSKSSLDEEKKSALKREIENVMRNTDEICSEDFSIERLAKLCNASKKDVSQVINEKFEQSFILLLSEYRVREACRRINDVTASSQFTLEAIGLGVGFKARESFSRAFKRVTGLSPSDYQKIAKERCKTPF